MRKTLLFTVLAFGISGLVSLGMPKTLAAGHEEKPLPQIPGITAPDQKPSACVDCHKNYPEMKFDARLTVVLKGWQKAADEKILAKAQGTMPAGIKLEGKHPDVSHLIKTIPNDCLMCHSTQTSTPQRVPEFRKMIHAIHLVGGKDNHFISNYGGTCTHCHKLDPKTGAWSIGSGQEQP
ncbi:hypothetical protein COW36_08185 [bacterium (Candidatus Blackallbacteria) CG17_big_fil_post_rev_8_21_14_2_50_48_46]|uniref:Uncharacterized protein n=1 Tax=bacterium (Candidatus Blackallbacteria) CG17_big_fil_post_rev_8_21_14_2_50_48_46 TaxID=2014261 RepID=A0A2M7G617_9BACT|nr:MAG: hypothetical protein COW64_24725 [bacterium (Candidatus Blackallbacteria) CG18_big_fil_WC_8_21_14_2_50_49_26]PIW17468.1 MAG: hypothetical protein COW36_08185 [bacterium (Candidatus Blackallbacteria) CG17_big_fil_post_rev_8_21_14_2_50_48_46]PIW48322.1 MAG: hypothetical protein COW20_09540 [bacterium (Candidatus Blackallbacteria) CG13_big_fil_rev_8_21_14_2_50_49_14]